MRREAKAQIPYCSVGFFRLRTAAEDFVGCGGKQGPRFRTAAWDSFGGGGVRTAAEDFVGCGGKQRLRFRTAAYALQLRVLSAAAESALLLRIVWGAAGMFSLSLFAQGKANLSNDKNPIPLQALMRVVIFPA